MRKYLLAKKLDKKYRALARQRYNAFGCNDKWYNLFRNHINFTSRILNQNGWDNCI